MFWCLSNEGRKYFEVSVMRGKKYFGVLSIRGKIGENEMPI